VRGPETEGDPTKRGVHRSKTAEDTRDGRSKAEGDCMLRSTSGGRSVTYAIERDGYVTPREQSVGRDNNRSVSRTRRADESSQTGVLRDPRAELGYGDGSDPMVRRLRRDVCIRSGKNRRAVEHGYGRNAEIVRPERVDVPSPAIERSRTDKRMYGRNGPDTMVRYPRRNASEYKPFRDAEYRRAVRPKSEHNAVSGTWEVIVNIVNIMIVLGINRR
jgi:hypothetical protein